LYEENRQLKLEVKRLQMALCAEEASHGVTHITLQQLRNTFKNNISNDSKNNSITDEDMKYHHAQNKTNKDPIRK